MRKKIVWVSDPVSRTFFKEFANYRFKPERPPYNKLTCKFDNWRTRNKHKKWCYNNIGYLVLPNPKRSRYVAQV